MTTPNTTDPAPRLDHLDTHSALSVLDLSQPELSARMLGLMPPARASRILAKLSPVDRARLIAVAPPGTDWADALRYPEGSVGRLLEDPPAVFKAGTLVADAIETLRRTVRERMVVYLFVVDTQEHLLGVVAFRELLFAERTQTLDSIMLRAPFFLQPQWELVQAMREVVQRHFPVYPVCESDGRLVGQVRGQALFEQQAFEISAQAGAMVGVEKEERLATPWARSFRFRHPWLLLNLLTVFVAAAVVGVFEGLINEVVVLAVFLPVLAGQCGNVGAQSLAVMLRSMTLGEMRDVQPWKVVSKEAWVGLLNGTGTGAIAGAAMWVTAHQRDDRLGLAVVVWVAMALSCMLSGIAGATIPLGLKRFGADPATASSIFLTTVTDVSSMGFFLGFASLLVYWV